MMTGEDMDIIVACNVIMNLGMLLLLLRKARSRRRFWVREIFRRRQERGEYHCLIQEMRHGDVESFFRYFRMTPSRFVDLLRLVGPSLRRQRTNWRQPISEEERLAITLRYLSTGDSQQTISFSFRVGRSTVCNIIEETCKVIWEVLYPIYLSKPTTDQWRRISQDFWHLWNFPNCIGAIDGKHIAIQAPANAGSAFFNYKGYHSVVLMALCDANYCFTVIDVGGYGRQSDGGIFGESILGRALEEDNLQLPEPTRLPGSDHIMNFVIVGDEAFPLKHYLMRPYPGQGLPMERRIFNYRLSRARRIIENTFGILASRWRIFRRAIIAKPEKVDLIIKAACVLHNFLKKSESFQPTTRRLYCPPTYVDYEDNQGTVIPGEWRQSAATATLLDVRKTGSNTFTRSAANMRDQLCQYFLTEAGQVAWQVNHINQVEPR